MAGRPQRVTGLSPIIRCSTYAIAHRGRPATVGGEVHDASPFGQSSPTGNGRYPTKTPTTGLPCPPLT